MMQKKIKKIRRNRRAKRSSPTSKNYLSGNCRKSKRNHPPSWRRAKIHKSREKGCEYFFEFEWKGQEI